MYWRSIVIWNCHSCKYCLEETIFYIDKSIASALTAEFEQVLYCTLIIRDIIIAIRSWPWMIWNDLAVTSSITYDVSEKRAFIKWKIQILKNLSDLVGFWLEKKSMQIILST